MPDELLAKTATEVGEIIRTGQATSVEVTKQLQRHVGKLNGRVNAYISFREEEALAEARTADAEIAAGKLRGPLHGVPMAIKDNLFVKDELTTMASRIHGNHKPDYDATVVAKLREAGVVLAGKLNMHEYAWGIDNNSPHFGAARNPWNLDKTPGGSSGGSGAAVAADMAFASLGTDTVGSVRIPSSANGVVGLKPTYGLVAKYGAYPLAWTMDHVGPITKSVDDAAAVLQAIAGYDPRDPSSAKVAPGNYVAAARRAPKHLVIGIEEDYFFRDVDDQVAKLVRAQINELEAGGARVKTVSIPALAHSEWAALATAMSEASTIHHNNLVKCPEHFGADIRVSFEIGELFTAVDYLQAQQIRRQLKQQFSAVLQEVDVIVSPTLPVMAPDIGSQTADLNGEQVDLVNNFIRFAGPSNLTGHPALSIPIGVKDGLPVGLQLMGNAFGEETLLQVAHQIEDTDPMEGQRAQVGK